VAGNTRLHIDPEQHRLMMMLLSVGLHDQQPNAERSCGDEENITPTV